MYIDFKAIKEAVSIEDAANLLNLQLKRSANQLRGGCPACGNKDERILAITPARGLFYCFDAKTGGDCIALVQHITGLDVKDAAEYLSPNLSPHTREGAHSSPSPTQRQEKVKEKSAPKRKNVEQVFDAEAFAAKLTYADDVAESLLIGEYRGREYHGHRYATGVIAGFSYLADGQLVPPKQWLPDTGNIVPFKQRA